MAWYSSCSAERKREYEPPSMAERMSKRSGEERRERWDVLRISNWASGVMGGLKQETAGTLPSPSTEVKRRFFWKSSMVEGEIISSERRTECQGVSMPEPPMLMNVKSESRGGRSIFLLRTF